MLLTSNLPPSKWEGIFKDDPMTTAAAIDRLVHHSVFVELNIPSYRLKQARHNGQMLDQEASCRTTLRGTSFRLRALPSTSSRFLGNNPRRR